MSPSFSTRFFDGMPCTISLFTDVQMLPGNPYKPFERGHRAVLAADELFGDVVELARRDARTNRPAQRLDRGVENLAPHRHQIDLARRLQLNHVPRPLRILAVTSSTEPAASTTTTLSPARLYQSSTGAVSVS